MQDLDSPWGSVDFSARLNDLVDLHFDGVWSRLAMAMGVAPSTMQNIKTGSEPRLDTLLRIANAFGLTLDSLVFGDNPLLLDRSSNKSGADAIKKAEESAPDYSTDKVSIPISYDIKASAGLGLDVANEHWGNTWVDPDWLLRLIGVVPHKGLRIITVSGSSMDDAYKDGDLVLVDITQNEISRSGVYVFRLDGELFIKKLHLRLDGKMEVISLNPEYPSYTLENGHYEGEIVAKVVSVWEFEIQ